MKTKHQMRTKSASFRRRFTLFGFGGLTVLGLAGCSIPAVNEQRLVAKPNMAFSDNNVFNYQSRLFQQTEPGAGDTGGAAAAGCSSCR